MHRPHISGRFQTFVNDCWEVPRWFGRIANLEALWTGFRYDTFLFDEESTQESSVTIYKHFEDPRSPNYAMKGREWWRGEASWCPTHLKMATWLHHVSRGHSEGEKVVCILARSDWICFWKWAVSGPALPRKPARAKNSRRQLERRASWWKVQWIISRTKIRKTILKKERNIFMTGRPDAFVFTQARQSQNNHSIRLDICAVNHSWPRHRPRIRCNYMQLYYQSTSHDLMGFIYG